MVADKLIVGCGYLGKRVAARWIERGAKVHALTRSEARAAELRAAGIEPIIGDITSPRSLAQLPAAATLLYAVGYDPRSGASREQVHFEGLARLLAEQGPTLRRFIFISTTGVYGEASGEWIDEETVCGPLTESGRVYVHAEQLVRDHPLGPRGVILRLAGIYGPGRVPRLVALRNGEPLEGDPDAPLNLIHVDDAAQAVLAAESSAQTPRTINICDGQPGSRREFYEFLAERLSLPQPSFIPQATPGRGAGRKRVGNQRMLRELGMRLRYPSFREGLADILAQENAP